VERNGEKFLNVCFWPNADVDTAKLSFQCLPAGSHDKRTGAERDIDRERSHGRTGSDCGDQGEKGDKLIITQYTRRATEGLGPTSLILP